MKFSLDPGILPGIESIRAGDIGKKRAMIEDILESSWKACTEPDPVCIFFCLKFGKKIKLTF
jgi:hypothetical protein